MGDRIDRKEIKDPADVSGWRKGEGERSPQDYSDISRHTQKNAEFEDKGQRTDEATGDAHGPEVKRS